MHNIYRSTHMRASYPKMLVRTLHENVLPKNNISLLSFIKAGWSFHLCDAVSRKRGNWLVYASKMRSIMRERIVISRNLGKIALMKIPI